MGLPPLGVTQHPCPEELGLSSPINQGGHPVYLAQLYSSIEMSNSQTKQTVFARTSQKDEAISTGEYGHDIAILLIVGRGF